MKFIFNISNCTTNLNETTNYSGTINITCDANSGYYFTSAPQFIYQNSYGVRVTKKLVTDETENPQHYYLNNFSVPTGDIESTFTANTIPLPKTDRLCLITIYNPTDAQLSDFGKIRYYNSGTGETIDLGNYITDVLKLFVNVPTDRTSNILIAGYNTAIQSNVVLDDYVITDCGSVDITPIYNNVLDYTNIKLEMYLPFYGFTTLDNDKVMNKTINLKYATSVLTGDSLITISDNETMLYTYDCKLSFKVPYRINDTVENNTAININSHYLGGFLPYINMIYNTAYNSNIGGADDRNSIIKNESGYIVCSDVFNTIKATDEEKTLIDNELKSGIIV